MKKYLIAGVLVVAFVAYLIFANKNPAPVATAPAGISTTTGPDSTPTTTASATPTGNPPSTSAPVGQYKDGTYTGSVADAFYGNLQAVAVIKGGAIVDVQFPQYPVNGHSGDVSTTALPVLKQEAIATQSANVNIVSGATQDSQAFQQSLTVALAQAKA